MSTVPEKNKMIARAFLGEVGGTPSVREYIHDYLELKVDIISIKDQPADGVTSYGTIGLSDFSLKKDGRIFEVGVELCCAIDSSAHLFPNIISSAAFNIMRSSVAPYPGACMQNYVKEYYKETNLPHLYFTSPFVWENLGLLKFNEIKIAFLLCFPISDKERLFLIDNGQDKFEELLERMDVNIFDFTRKSSID